MDRKLFDREIPASIPSISGLKRIAFGDSGTTAQNMTLNNLKTWLGITSGATKQFIVPIGVWNMVANSSSSMINLNFPLQPGQFFPTTVDFSKIRGIKVMILSDAGTAMTDFLSVQNGTASTVPQIQIGTFSFIYTTTTVYLTRRAGSYYTTAGGYSGSGNRGWILVEYVD